MASCTSLGMELKRERGKEMSIEEWHKLVLSYGHLVDRWTKYFWGINKSFLYSYEDLHQTIWYILMVGLVDFNGKGDEEKFLNWYIKNKVTSVIVYNRKPPKCKDAPFTPMKLDYVSPDDSTDLNELFYSDEGE